MSDMRASEIKENMRIREYGDLDEDGFTVAQVDWHGDTVLVTTTGDSELSFDRDEVVELLPPRLIMVGGKPVSSCCQASIERTCEYTDTHVFTVEESETDETGAVTSATYYFQKTYDGTDGTNVVIACSSCGQEIEQDEIDWREG